MCAIGWCLGWWAFGRPKTVAALGTSAATPSARSVTVVVPARNEELSIGHLLADLDATRPAPDRVVVVDDHSTDRTAAIVASQPGVELVESPALPAGWVGKCWACHTGSETVDSGVAVFADADVRLAPDALAAVVEEQDRRGGLVSVQPWHRTERLYEQASALFNVIAVMGTAAGTRRDVPAAFGPLMVTTIEEHRAVGGHEAVRDQVVEDMALGRRHHRDGSGSHVLLGRGGVSFRMYPGGFGQLVEGWTKNFATGAASTRVPRLLAIVAWIVGMGTAIGLLVDGLRGAAPVWPAVAVYVAVVVQLAVLFRVVGRFGVLSAALVPVHLAVFVLVFARSVWCTVVRRRVRWRGRDLPIVADAAAPLRRGAS